MSEVLNFQPKEVLATGEDSSGDDRTVKVNETDLSQALNYIPPRMQMVGKDSNGNFRKIIIGTGGQFLS